MVLWALGPGVGVVGIGFEMKGLGVQYGGTVPIGLRCGV